MNYEFRVEGRGMSVPAGSYEADNELEAFRLARRSCKHFELPGWVLICVTTKSAEPIGVDRNVQ